MNAELVRSRLYGLGKAAVACAVVATLIAVIGEFAGSEARLYLSLITLASLVVVIIAFVRFCHSLDQNAFSWIVIISLLPVVGLIWAFYELGHRTRVALRNGE